MVDKPLPIEALTAEQFRSSREALDLNVTELARMLNIQSARTVRRWEAGGAEVPGAVVVLMKLFADIPGAAVLAQRLADERRKLVD